MSVRRATEADRETLRELWLEFEAEIPPPPGFQEDWDEAWDDLSKHVRAGLAAIAEDDEGPVGYVFVAEPEKGRAHLTDAYVRPRARRQGVMRALVHNVLAELAERGDVTHVSLDVLTSNADARAIWQRWGFAEVLKLMMVDLKQLEQRLAPTETASVGSVHAQTDDERAVERIVMRFLPRLREPSRTILAPVQNGWIAVYNDRCDEDRDAQRRLGAELSDGLGVAVAFALERGDLVRFLLFERGRMVDEYLSVPNYYGPLAKVDELALAANSTLVSRLTGADPARVRAVARTASTPSELDPAPELLRTIAETMGIDRAGLGFEVATELPGAREIDR
jgi:ribosomal protein S18 acetylase RimI-like enzyme